MLTKPLAISAITLMEIAMGLEKAERIRELDTHLARLRPLQVPKSPQRKPAWRELSTARSNELERRSVAPIQSVAATAPVHDLTLVTGNVNHYERVRTLGHPLRIENWRD
jgi:tRNA(fMet)-specific endonuclease VapC